MIDSRPAVGGVMPTKKQDRTDGDLQQASLWSQMPPAADVAFREDTVVPSLIVSRDEALSPHRYSGLFGTRSPGQRQALKEAMRISGGAVDVVVLDDQILWDPDRYEAAGELGFEVRFIEFSGEDPIAFLCAQKLHELRHHAGTRAVIVASNFPWVGRGRPRKYAATDDVLSDERQAKTAEQLANLAGVSITTIRQAKEICSFGLAELVIAGRFTFGPAYRKVTAVKAAGLGKEVENGKLDVDAAWRRAIETSPESSDLDRQRNPSKQDLFNQVKALESEVEGLRRQLRDGEGRSQPRSLEPEDHVRQLEQERDRAARRARAAETRVKTVTKERDALTVELETLQGLLAESGGGAPAGTT